MTKEQLMTVANKAWLGRLCIYKPKKGEQVGIPYKPWHHIAIIDDVVLTYVWDTREIIDAYRLSDLAATFETVKIADNGRPILIGADTSDRAKKIVAQLLQTYSELPIINGTGRLSLSDVKDRAADALATIDDEMFDILDDTKIIFVDKRLPVPDELYMYQEMQVLNPNKRKFADNQTYIGQDKYLAIEARCAILRDWAKLVERSRQ